MLGDEHRFLKPNPAFVDLDNRRQKQGLAHELGAGKKCTKCGDKCPGFQLHFWRKVCINCWCGEAQHNVVDASDPGFYFVRKIVDQPLLTEDTLKYSDIVEEPVIGEQAKKEVVPDQLPIGISPIIAGKYKKSKKDEAQPLMQSAVTSTASGDKDYSPFKMFNKIPGNIVGSFDGWGNDKADEYNMNKTFGMTVSTTASSTSVEQPSVESCPSKPPGYRSSMPAAGSPGSTGSVSSVSSWSGSNTTQSTSQPSAGPGYKKPAEPAGQLYAQQERCNSAPGTPVSPLVPSPIGPPSGSSNSKPANSSPGSEPDWFRAPGHGGPRLCSMTPDGDLLDTMKVTAQDVEPSQCHDLTKVVVNSMTSYIDNVEKNIVDPISRMDVKEA